MLGSLWCLVVLFAVNGCLRFSVVGGSVWIWAVSVNLLVVLLAGGLV